MDLAHLQQAEECLFTSVKDGRAYIEVRPP